MRWILVLVAWPALAFAAPKKPKPPPPPPVARPTPGRPPPPPATPKEAAQRESRIEFDERLVQGQTAAGAIYLFQRGESEFRSMVKLPESFRDRTVDPVLHDRPAAGGRSPSRPER